jgi:predicted nucleic acid-binding protein
MLLDTSGLLALLDQREAYHKEARLLSATATVRVTHSYVLAEFVPLCQSRGVPRATTLGFSRELLQNPEVMVVWVDDQLHDAGLTFLEARADKQYSLCDAVSFVIMVRYRLAEALTTDRHFEQAGFRRLLQ